MTITRRPSAPPLQSHAGKSLSQVGTSSGSASLNSHPSPVQLMKDWHDLSESSSSRNCHSWMGPLPVGDGGDRC